MRALPILLLAAVSCASSSAVTEKRSPAATPLRFAVSFPSSLSATPLDGRMILAIAKAGSVGSPVEQHSDENDTSQIFGVDVEALGPDKAVIIDAAVFGYPLPSTSALPPGDYIVQAVLQRYETFTRSDGHTVKLPPDRGEGQDWKKAPGNLSSAAVALHLDPASSGEQRIALDHAFPEMPVQADTKYVKHVRIQSDRLTKFWGRPMYLGAIVLVPEGFDSHPNAHYPLVIEHGHFGDKVFSWRESPPDEKLPPVDLEAINVVCPNGHEKALCTKAGYERLVQQYGYDGYRSWAGANFPRVLEVLIQHANPYYDDSYAVNSENLGPYGDAITYELIPYIEKTFRGLGPWARGMMGGSTGGWESLAAQVFYPAEYNGAIANCPDPIDFHAYTTVDIYEDKNAYYSEGPFRKTPRPASRNYLGQTRSLVEQENHSELVQGTHSRSGGQWDIWQAVFSPVGSDGYPRPIWDKKTGEIDPGVAAYWREHYDLEHIIERDWARLQPLLAGKLEINVGLSDNYFLNDAVYRLEAFFKNAKPASDAKIDYGARDEHCWSGDHAHANAISRLTYRQRFIPRFAEHWRRSAPPGADLASWRY